MLPWRSYGWGDSLDGEGYHANHHHDHQQGDEDPLPVPGFSGDRQQLLKYTPGEVYVRQIYAQAQKLT